MKLNESKGTIISSGEMIGGCLRTVAVLGVVIGAHSDRRYERQIFLHLCAFVKMSTKTADLMKLDLYKIIGVPNDATDKEVCLINFQKRLMGNSGKMLQ